MKPEIAHDRGDSSPPASLGSPFGRLASRVAAFMLVCLIATGIAVAASAVHTFRGFLRAEAEHRLERTLERAATDLARFEYESARGAGLLAATQEVRAAANGGLAPGNRLERLLESHPQYAALLVERRDREIVSWIGRRVTIPESLRRRPTGAPEQSERTSDGLQLASAAVRDADGSLLGWAHVLFAEDAIDRLLEGHATATGARLELSDGQARALAASHPLPHQMPRKAEAGDGSGAFEFRDAAGEEWLGASVVLDPMGRTLTAAESNARIYAPIAPAVRRVLLGWMVLAVGSCLAAFGLVHSISKPVVALSEAARRIAAGERDIELPERRSADEIGVLTDVFNDMTHQLARNAREIEAGNLKVERTNQQLRDQNEELQQANEILEQLSITDGLTRLHNHRFFQEYLDKEIKRATRSGRPLCLILIDVDHFKRWNDYLGHAGGDEILRSAAEVMNALIRESDLLARYGGDEFALLTPNTEIDGALHLAEKIRDAISQTVFFDSDDPARTRVTTSIGVSTYRGDRRAFFNDADQALYAAKAGGRDCVIAAAEDENEHDV